jgi:hypothetical protein
MACGVITPPGARCSRARSAFAENRGVQVPQIAHSDSELMLTLDPILLASPMRV